MQEVTVDAAWQTERRHLVVAVPDYRRIERLLLPAEATEDHIVGVVGVELGPVPATRRRREVVRRQVDHLLQVAADVDHFRLHLARRSDVLVQEVAAQHRLGLRAGTHRSECRNAIEWLAVARAGTGSAARHPGCRQAGRAVATGEDPAVVAEDRVLTDTARDPVVAPTADDLVVVGVAVGDVVAAAEVDEVVAQAAVNLIVAGDLDPKGAPRTRVPAVAAGVDCEDRAATILGLESRGAADPCPGREPLWPEVCAARGVVEQCDTAHDNLAVRAVHVVVDVRHVLRRRRVAARRAIAGRVVAHIDAVDADDADDASVVADDRVGVAGVTVTGDHHPWEQAAIVVAGAVEAAVAEQDVRAVWAVVRGDEAEEVGAATNDVVLAEPTEHDVVAAAPLDVVLSVGRGKVEGGDQVKVADEVAGAGVCRIGRARFGSRDTTIRGSRGADVLGCGKRRLDPAVALDDVVAELTEDQVVVRPAGEVVVAERPGRVHPVLDGKVVERGVVDGVLRPPRSGIGVTEVAGDPVGEQHAGVVGVDWARVARRQRTVGAGVDLAAVQRLEPQAGDVADPAQQCGDVVAEDQVVLLVAVCHVVAGTGDDHVAADVAEDRVVVAVLKFDREDPQHVVDQRRLDPLWQGERLVRVLHGHRDEAVVAADNVVVVRLWTASHSVGAFAVDQVAAGLERVEHR